VRVAIAFLGVALVFAACRKSTRPPTVSKSVEEDSAEQIVFDVRTTMTETGVKRGDLFADTLFVLENQTRFLLRRVRANFNTETGAANGTLKGDRGTYNLQTKTLEGFGNVVVTSTKGERLSSPHLKYVESANEISSDSSYTLVRGSEVQQGIGFVSDPNLIRFRCKRSCGGSANVPFKTLPKP
jgi:LPS export ABC transporter protein LptC